jgi:hypothetical protein
MGAQIQYLVQGLQYAIHPEIQAKYVLVTNGVHSSVYDAHGGVYLEKEIYRPILEFKASELIQKWVEIFNLLSVERLRTRIETDLKSMFDKLCLSSLDQSYPKRLIAQIGSSVGDNVRQIEKQVRGLYLEGIKKEIDARDKCLEQLDPESLFSQMDTPLTNGQNTEGHRFVEKSLISGLPALEIFNRLTSDFERQGIFRKIQTFVALCTLYRRADDIIQELCQNFFDQYKDGELPLINQVECALLRWTRKSSTVSHYPLLRPRLQRQLESAPELIRFVRPPTVLEHLYPFELMQNHQMFAKIKDLSEQQLKNFLKLLLKIESEIENDYETAYSRLSDTEKQIGGFENYGMGGKYPFFRILISRGLQPQ